MSLQTLDLLAVLLALAAIALRALDEPKESTLAATISLAASTIAGYFSRRRRARQLQATPPPTR
jgi:hypothetical protein